MHINNFIYQYCYDISLLSEQSFKKIKEMMNINKTYEYKLYTGDEMDKYILNNFSTYIYNTFCKLKSQKAKINFWSYLILYNDGGIYLDINKTLSIDINTIINPCDDAIISLDNNKIYFVNDCLFFAKKHPILKKVIELIIDNINNINDNNDNNDNNNNQNKNNLYEINDITGYNVFTRAILYTHLEKYNMLNYSLINNKTNEIYKNFKYNYKIYGVNYNNCCHLIITSS